MEGDCFGCGDDNAAGLKLVFSVEPPGVVATYHPRPEHRGPLGYLHGGLAVACLDETMSAVGYALTHTPGVTATLDVQFRKPVPLDTGPVRIEAWPDDNRARSRWRVRGRLLLADGFVAVEARSLFVSADRAGAP